MKPDYAGWVKSTCPEYGLLSPAIPYLAEIHAELKQIGYEVAVNFDKMLVTTIIDELSVNFSSHI